VKAGGGEQGRLWDDTIYDAVGSAAKASGGLKLIGHKLWPAKDPESAYTKLRTCIDSDHAQKLCLEEFLQIARWARDKNDHSIMRFLARELRYREPEPVSEEDQAIDVLTHVDELREEFRGVLKELDRISSRRRR
jgi:hypothetical protein